MFHQIMTLNNKKLGLIFKPTNHSNLLYLYVFLVGLPTLLSEKTKGCLKSVYRESILEDQVSTLPRIVLSAFGPMLSRLIKCATV
jgi:hypothetical protein